MSRPIVKIKATGPGGQSLKAFSDLITKRMKYLNEAANSSTLAMGLNFFRSVRAATKVAKVGRVNDIPIPKLQEMTFLKPGYQELGRGRTWNTEGTRRMCLRLKSGQCVTADPKKYGDATVIYGMKGLYTFHGMHRDVFRAAGCWAFQMDSDGGKTVKKFIIAAPNAGIAEKAAQMILWRQRLRWAGLAKRAISALMSKVWRNEKLMGHRFAPRIENLAVKVTEARSTILKKADGGGAYVLCMRDNLDYAVDAVKGGRAGIDLAMRKACNKTAGLIQHKCKDLLLPREVQTPFPEIRRRA